MANKILQQIAFEKLSPGFRLGTEAELGEKHGVSRFTVRHALAMLEKKGYVSREKARGTFVRMSAEIAPETQPARGTAVVVCSNEQASHASEDFAFATVLRSMERRLSKLGFLVQILGVGEDEREDRARILRLLESDSLEGFISVGSVLEPYRDIVRDYPFVTSCAFYTRSYPTVGDDIDVVCRTCMDYLLTRGHRVIGMICGPWVDVKAFGLLAESHRKAFEEAGLPWPRDLLLHAYPDESLKSLAKVAITSPRRPTAIFAENWRVCEGILAAARELGTRIPDDLSVIAYGQNVLMMDSPVAVTAYVPDSEAIGSKAAEILAAVVDGQDQPGHKFRLPGTLIERESVKDLR